jgi:hypothetical protein
MIPLKMAHETEICDINGSTHKRRYEAVQNNRGRLKAHDRRLRSASPAYTLLATSPSSQSNGDRLAGGGWEEKKVMEMRYVYVVWFS